MQQLNAKSGRYRAQIDIIQRCEGLFDIPKKYRTIYKVTEMNGDLEITYTWTSDTDYKPTRKKILAQLARKSPVISKRRKWAITD